MQREAMERPGRIEPMASALPSIATAPICEKCRGHLAFVGKLPAIRLMPLLEVYKCAPCNHVVTMRP
jgi:hypothetical protein